MACKLCTAQFMVSQTKCCTSPLPSLRHLSSRSYHTLAKRATREYNTTSTPQPSVIKPPTYLNGHANGHAHHANGSSHHANGSSHHANGASHHANGSSHHYANGEAHHANGSASDHANGHVEDAPVLEHAKPSQPLHHSTNGFTQPTTTNTQHEIKTKYKRKRKPQSTTITPSTNHQDSNSSTTTTTRSPTHTNRPYNKLKTSEQPVLLRERAMSKHALYTINLNTKPLNNDATPITIIPTETYLDESMPSPLYYTDDIPSSPVEDTFVNSLLTSTDTSVDAILAAQDNLPSPHLILPDLSNSNFASYHQYYNHHPHPHPANVYVFNEHRDSSPSPSPSSQAPFPESSSSADPSISTSPPVTSPQTSPLPSLSFPPTRAHKGLKKSDIPSFMSLPPKERTLEEFNKKLAMAVREGFWRSCLDLYAAMEKSKILPNLETFHYLLSALINTPSSQHANHIFADLLKYKITPQTRTYNLVLAANARFPEYCDKIYEHMRKANVPLDMETALTIIRSHIQYSPCELPELRRSRAILDDLVQVLRASTPSPSISSPDTSSTNPYEISLTHVFNTILAALPKTAMRDFVDSMPSLGIPLDVVTYNTLLRNASTAEQEELLTEMSNRGVVPSVSTYNTLITNAVRCRDLAKTKELYNNMLTHGLEPDIVTYKTITLFLAKEGEYDYCWEVLEGMKQRGWS